MIPPEHILKIIAVVGATVAMVTDMRTGKIFNWLTFPLMFLGWILNAAYYGPAGFGYSFCATLIGIGFYICFAAIGVVGMGDVKLMGGIGALGGPKYVIGVFLYTCVIGIPHSLLIQYMNYGKNSFAMLMTSFTTGAFRDKTIKQESTEIKYKFYLGIDILLGCLLAWGLEIPIGF